ncbi:MAG: hypothetical protein HOB03_02600 [Gammaproteobacteria bacterium]|nr:hypothetical protein [Gammaproteobacteria bacterium]
MEQQDPNTFTQKDLMQHLLNASQHVATREELLDVKSDMDRRFELVDKRFDELRSDIKEQGKRHDRLSWYISAGMLAIFFKEHLVKLLT